MNGRLADQDARDLAGEALDRSILLEAGAGTGKTTVLVHRLVRLIRTGVDLGSIAAITFTEKAAGELKQRLRDALESCAARAAQDGDASGLVAFRAALLGLQNAHVSTIHGFCHKLLRERPVEAGVDPGFELADGATLDASFDAAFEAFLVDCGVPETGLDGEALRWALADGMGVDVLRALARARFESRGTFEDDAVPPRPDVDASRDALVARFARLRELLAECTDRNDPLARWIVAVDPSGTGGATDAAESARFERERDFVARLAALPARPKGAKTRWTTAAVLDEARAAADAWIEAWIPLAAALQEHYAVRLVRLLESVTRRVEAAKRAAGLLDFHDLLLRTRDVLRDRVDVRAHFQRRFPRLLVDEFQDTDPLQAEIVFFLGEDPDAGTPARAWDEVRVAPGRLFLVGDPKQSIYRFRAADIEIYERAKAVMRDAGGAVATIRVNFRSAPGILDWVNARCGALIEKSTDGLYQPEYVDLVPRPEAESDASDSARVVVLGDPRLRDPDAAPGLAEDARRVEAAAIAAYLKRVAEGGADAAIVRAKDGTRRAATYQDCAILLRATTSLEIYEEALRAHGVPYRVAGGKHLYSRAEVKAAVALFRCIDDPTDSVATVATLRSPLFGISDVELFQFVRDGGAFGAPAAAEAAPPGALRLALTILMELHALRHRVPVAECVAEAYARTRALEIFRIKPSGDQRVANLLKFIDVARALERDREHTFRAFVDEIRGMERVAGEDADAVLLDDDEVAVSILTVHKAKGLEFPIVVLADLGKDSTDRDRILVERADADSAARLHFAHRPRDAAPFATPGYAAAKARELRRVAAEERRLFYVAATRAGTQLLLPRLLSVRAEKAIVNPTSTAPVTLLRGDPLFDAPQERRSELWFDVGGLALDAPPEPAFRLALDAAGLADPASVPAAAAVLRERAVLERRLRGLFERGAARAPVTSASAGKDPVAFRREVVPTSAVAAPGMSADARGRVFGTLVHGILERVDWRTPDRARLRSDADALSAPLGLDDAAVRAACELVERVLDLPLGARLEACTRVLAEVPFVFERDGVLVEGAIDVLGEEADGRLLIVDWKTDLVRGDALDARVALYAEQGRIYAEAARRATGRAVAEVLLCFLRPGEVRTIETPPA